MHASVLAWIPDALPAGEVSDRRVLEVGSYDVNGSVRPLIEAHGPASYIGVDQTPGPGVDRVVSCYDLAAEFPDPFDVVVSTEMLEHVDDWRAATVALCSVVAVGGLLVVTTRSEGFPYHPFPIDCWRYSVDGMRRLLVDAGFDPVEVRRDPQVPGVFAKARKPAGWSSCGELSGRGVTTVCG